MRPRSQQGMGWAGWICYLMSHVCVRNSDFIKYFSLETVIKITVVQFKGTLFFFFKDFTYLEREGEKHQCVVASHARPQ